MIRGKRFQAMLGVATVLAVGGVLPVRSAIVSEDTFGLGPDAFTLTFVEVGQPGNSDDAGSTGQFHGPYGGVEYAYRLGRFEISQSDISRATAQGLMHVTAGAWSGDQPAAGVSWLEAAAFVNWLNVSQGHAPAYHLGYAGGWSLGLWTPDQAWTAGGTNLFRHRDAYYFLPSEDEWYKAAYYSGDGGIYFDYPTAGNAPPGAVSAGTNQGTAVYQLQSGPANVTQAGGDSPYGTVGQGGNVWEWMESAWDGINDSSSEALAFRGGGYAGSELALRASYRDGLPSSEYESLGFRVASIVPEPTGILPWLAGAAAVLGRWRRTRCRRPMAW